MNLTVIIPTHNAGDDLARCLDALTHQTRPPDRVLVVDDASTDGSAAIAPHYGFDLLRLDDGPQGPAIARNRGVAATRFASDTSGTVAPREPDHDDVILFIDADCVAHRDTLALVADRFTQHPDLDALFGSYDDSPPAPGLISRYKNLLHHYTHQHARRDAWTFWSGCGAIRRDAFDRIGGFSRLFAKPSIEDIDLGVRLRRAGGTITLCPEVQVTHLKRWTLRSWIRTDIFGRAVPWTRLLKQSRDLPADLNLGWPARLSAAAAWAALLLLPVAIFQPWLLLAVAACLAALAWLNRSFLALLARRLGPLRAVGGFALHWLYYLYSSATFVLVMLWPKTSSQTQRAVG